METKIVKIGNKVIGGGNPILIQSMTNTKTENVADTVAQINALTDLGCDIIRCAVPTIEAARAIKEIKKQISIPLVADIHFDYKLAIAAIENGAVSLNHSDTPPCFNDIYYSRGFSYCQEKTSTFFSFFEFLFIFYFPIL